MKTAYDVILRPVITEKSMAGIPNMRYTFAVAKDANKIEIAKAVESAFDVKVDKVNTARTMGKMKRQGRYIGRTPEVKKAVVTLKADSKGIEFFDSMR